MSEEQQELKDCPFCGGEVELVENGQHCFYVRCMMVECDTWSGSWLSEAKAITAWNTRAALDSTQAQVDDDAVRNAIIRIADSMCLTMGVKGGEMVTRMEGRITEADFHLLVAAVSRTAPLEAGAITKKRKEHD